MVPTVPPPPARTALRRWLQRQASSRLKLQGVAFFRTPKRWLEIDWRSSGGYLLATFSSLIRIAPFFLREVPAHSLLRDSCYVLPQSLPKVHDLHHPSPV